MQSFEEIGCPYCGQWFGIEIDTSAGNHRMTTDCEVCCRPFLVSVDCEPGEVFSISTEGEGE